MKPSTKISWFVLFSALSLSAGSAMSRERQAWFVESTGFSQEHSAELILDVENGKYWASQKDMESLGFDISKLPTVNGKIDLASGGTLTINDLKQSIALAVHPEMLPENKFDFRASLEPMAPKRAITGGFVNYDIRASADDSTNNVTSLLDANAFVSGNIRANLQTLVRSGEIGRQRRAERVSASLISNDPSSAITWSMGDAYSTGGQGINPVSFTGFQIKKDFALQTGFVAQPSYDLNGSAAAPSAVDVYLDNRKVMSSPLPAGPFSIRNLTGFGGASNARIVVRDIFGQEQVITEQLLGGPEFLKKNLSSYAFQAGVMRPETNINDGRFAAGYFRYGVSDFLTTEVNAEKSYDGRLLPDVEHVGAALAVSTPVGNFGLSRRTGTGQITTTSYQGSLRRQTWMAQFNASNAYASRDYMIMGARSFSNQTRRTLQGSLQMDNGLGLSILSITSPDSGSTGISINYSQRKAYATTYSLSLNKSRGITLEPISAFLSMSIPIERDIAVRSRSVTTRAGRESSGLANQSVDYYDAPNDTFGTTYRLREEGQKDALRYDAEVTHRAPSMETGIAASGAQSGTGYRAFMRGSIIEHDGHLGASRWIDGGYAVVDAGEPDIKVRINGQSQGATNRDGIAYVPILLPYTKTGVSLDPETVPINYDNNTEFLAAPIAGGAKAVFRGVKATMVKLANIKDGSITIADQTYPITDRGFFVELTEGDYVGETEKKQKVHFTVPKSGKGGISYVQGAVE